MKRKIATLFFNFSYRNFLPEADAAYKVAVKAVDQAAAKGLLHSNNAAHKKSAMTVKLNKLASPDYCSYCYKQGKFAGEMSMEEMIDFSGYAVLAKFVVHPVGHIGGEAQPCLYPKQGRDVAGKALLPGTELGPEADGSASPDYCSYCYKQGKFAGEMSMRPDGGGERRGRGPPPPRRS